MSRSYMNFRVVCTLALLLTGGTALGQLPVGTAFTYQGDLQQGGVPVDDVCAFEFTLWNAPIGGSVVGPTLTPTVTVSEGGFTVALDFGDNIFTGLARWLELAVCCPPDYCKSPPTNFTTLAPRQELTPTPHALALPGMWTQQTASTPSLVGGYSGNSVGAAIGATISGGGDAVSPNLTNVDFATIGGGKGNSALGPNSTVSGGVGNEISGFAAVVSGGQGNISNSNYAVIGGGLGHSVTGVYAVVGGGQINTANGNFATVGGGRGNTASGSDGTVAGGAGNTASGIQATVGGGFDNMATNSADTVGGGSANTASGITSTVGGGAENTASGLQSTVAGGDTNTASGLAATIPGGRNNSAAGEFAFAAGRAAKADSPGMFVWADDPNIDLDFPSPTEPNFIPANDQFLVRSRGGVVFVTSYVNATGDSTAGVKLTAGAGAWSSLSDRNAKEHVEPVDPRDVLECVAAMPISTWNYKAQEDSIRHMGPMAQDFHEAFGIGESEKFITTIDADGVALAAIQGLHEIVKEKDAEIAQLIDRLTKLEALVGQLLALPPDQAARE